MTSVLIQCISVYLSEPNFFNRTEQNIYFVFKGYTAYHNYKVTQCMDY